MKKTILLMAFLAFSTLMFAQTKPTFGVRGGIISSSMNGEAISNLRDLLDYTNGMVTTGSRTGFFAGGFANFSIGETFSIEPGLYYSQKGYELKGALNVKGLDFLGINAKAQLNAQYIDLPVLVKANVGGFQLFLGPQLSYLAKADLRTTAGALGFNILDSKRDATSQFNRWDAAVTGGIGYTFGNGFNIAASYDYGLSKVDANKNFSSYNRAFKVGVGFAF